jgi:hypothetical protein
VALDVLGQAFKRVSVDDYVSTYTAKLKPRRAAAR